jgi:hypothetical protein
LHDTIRDLRTNIAVNKIVVIESCIEKGLEKKLEKMEKKEKNRFELII